MTTRKPAKATAKSTSKAAPKAAPKFVTVERPTSKRGRKAIDKPGMTALVANWKNFPVGATIVLPDGPPTADHADVTLARYHFRKFAAKAGLKPGVDFTIEAHPEHKAVITRLV